MGKKTLWAICSLNVVAGAFAVAWVTKSYWQPRSKLAPLTATAPEPVDIERLWSEFTNSQTYERAYQALASIPSSANRQERLWETLNTTEAAVSSASAPAAARCAAAIAVWGDGIAADGDDFRWLLMAAEDRNRTALEREAALRAVILAAQRRHKAAPEDPGDGWREFLAAWLEETDWGRSSSVAGLALHAQSFALTEKIAPVDRTKLVERLALLLNPRNGASEAVMLAALDVGRQLGASELLESARALARNPPSDACLQASLGAIADWGTEQDLSWLDGYTASGAGIQRLALNARASLAARLTTPPAPPSP